MFFSGLQPRQHFPAWLCRPHCYALDDVQIYKRKNNARSMSIESTQRHTTVLHVVR